MPKQNVPALRLEGFDGEWSQSTLGSFARKVNEKNVDLSVAETFTNSAERGVISQTEYFKHQVSNDTNLGGYYVVQPDDFIYNPRISTGAPVGPINRNKLERVGVVSPLYTVFRLSVIDHCFLDWFFKSPHWHGFMRENGDSGARGDRLSIGQELFFQMPVSCPPTFEEQQAIGAIFTNLDAAINQHTLKHKALQQSKTALMQRMFPQEGQTVPELRLKGFSGEWEETTLGELGSTYGGLSGKKKEDFGHGDAMYVTYKDIFSRALITDTSQCERVEVDASQNEVRYGDIFFTTSSEIPEEVGLSAVWLIDKPNVYLNSFCFGFRPTGGFDLHFLGHVLRSPAVRSQFLLLAQGISRFNISKTKAANISLYAPPTLEEQQAIGAVFTNLDQLIAAGAQYIASLKQAKTALLQRMFI